MPSSMRKRDWQFEAYAFLAYGQRRCLIQFVKSNLSLAIDVHWKANDIKLVLPSVTNQGFHLRFHSSVLAWIKCAARIRKIAGKIGDSYRVISRPLIITLKRLNS